MIDNSEPEYILCAAINYGGTIVCGHRHGDCYDTLKQLIGKFDMDKFPKKNFDGFLTSHNRYVGREEAFVIATERKQILRDVTWNANEVLLDGLDIDPNQKPILISEDLY